MVFAVTGSHGDVHPFLAVALEMQARGRPVLLLAAPDYAAKAAAAGVPFAPMRPGWNDIAPQLGLDPARFVRRVAANNDFIFDQFLIPAAARSFDDALPAVEGASLVVVNHLAFGAQIAAEAAGCAVAVLALQPLVLLSAHDPPQLGGRPWLPMLRHALGPRAVRQVIVAGLALRRGRGLPLETLRERAGLEPVGAHWLTAGVRDAIATICLWSPLLGGVQPDHPAGTVIAGSLLYDDEPGAEVNEALDSFLDAGAAPWVLTLGTVAGWAPDGFYREGIEAARRLGLRTVLAAGPHAPDAVRKLAADDVFVAGYVRYSRLFPRARLVAHHGGMGACLQALRCGVPQLLAPRLSDQHDNARRLAALGAARTVPFNRWRADRACASARTLLTEPVRKRAAKLGRITSTERGARSAADVLEAALNVPPFRRLPQVVGA